jgi:hypothetical protein
MVQIYRKTTRQALNIELKKKTKTESSRRDYEPSHRIGAFQAVKKMMNDRPWGPTDGLMRGKFS